MKAIIWLFKWFVVLLALMLIYSFFRSRDIKKIDNFCSEMLPGLDINQVHIIAEKYDVGSKSIRDPKSVKNQALGINSREGVGFFSVSTSTPVDYACDVYHDYHVVLSAKSQ